MKGIHASHKLTSPVSCGCASCHLDMEKMRTEDPGAEHRLARCLCEPPTSKLGFSLRKHTLYSGLMVRVKQEHLLMKR